MIKLFILPSLFIVTSSFASQILFLGDSLTAGYGVERKDSFVYLLEQKLKKFDRSLVILNGSESGSLSSSVISTAKFYIEQKKIDLVVLTVGGNDARQGTPTKVIENNITQAVKYLKQNKIKVLLVGMRIFPNLGPQYAEDFKKLYPRVAAQLKVQFVPFLLEGVAGVKELNQEDGFHPNANGHKMISETLYPYIKKLL